MARVPIEAAPDAEATRIRAEARWQWSEEPAGAAAAGDLKLDSPEAFAAVEDHRYREQSWMHETFDYERFAGAEVLEIGVGLGTDHMQFARAGARMTGIDLTPRCIELTRRRCELEGHESDLRVMDAESLEFPDESFDVVYSFGVLHHIPSTESAFAEVRRVLRPEGVFIGALYNRHSFAWARMLAVRYATLGFLREPLERRQARIERGGGHATPRVRLFAREELRTALYAAGFTRVALARRHLGLGRFTQYFPMRLERALGKRLGWYLVHEAR